MENKPMNETTPFIYKLNAMENAAQSANPAQHGYREKREAVLAYVSRLESALAVAEEAMRPILESDFGSLWAWPVTAKSTALARLRAALAQIEELRK